MFFWWHIFSVYKHLAFKSIYGDPFRNLALPTSFMVVKVPDKEPIRHPWRVETKRLAGRFRRWENWYETRNTP